MSLLEIGERSLNALDDEIILSESVYRTTAPSHTGTYLLADNPPYHLTTFSIVYGDRYSQLLVVLKDRGPRPMIQI